MTDSLNLDFVRDERLRAVLRDYHAQAGIALGARSYLGAIVGYGAVVEGLLTWALKQKECEAINSSQAPRDKQGNVFPLEEWGLASLIKVCVQLDLIGKVADKAAWALKDFRNFIHPFNVLKQSARPDGALAESAKSGMAEILRSLQGRTLL